jgi:hypothetical protein
VEGCDYFQALEPKGSSWCHTKDVSVVLAAVNEMPLFETILIKITKDNTIEAAIF